MASRGTRGIARELGETIEVAGERFFAFPSPEKLQTLTAYPGLNETKISRLQAVARAALDGLLDRAYLRSLDDDVALAKLEALPGIGPFFSQGILYRGAGKKDGLTHDDMTYQVIRRAYGEGDDTSQEALLSLTEPWRPYRMWVNVLLHVWASEDERR